ncbi:TIGR00269 family protein [Candidatus Micrarchaeota archaeon]|nr:TIGR00269 family protein [Candidatus Micrarchaeota archaeon]
MERIDGARCHCGKEPAIFLHYARKHLCEEHFIRMFDKRFRKTLTAHKMLRKGDRVAVGLSGGKDSTVLLHSLAQLRKDLPFEIVALTIDEGIKGYRARTLGIARAECEKLGIEQAVLRFDKETGRTLDQMVKDETRNRKPDAGVWGPDAGGRKPDAANPLPCTHCGVVRRYLLNKGARELKATKLALGHNLDDMAQTVMMNIMRNEPARLARLNEPVSKNTRFVPRIRPLMLTPEKENAIYAMVKGIDIEHVECPYARFAFRGHVRKMLNETEERYPGTKFKIVNAFLDMEGGLRMKYGAGAPLAECSGCGEPCSGGMCMFCRRVRAVR